MTKTRRETIIPLIPASPLCFPDRLTWVEFVVSADESVARGDRGPIDLRKPEPRFNHQWNFCADCLALHALAMVAQGRCNPQHLQQLQAKEEPARA